jgi:DNA modification methylase
MQANRIIQGDALSVLKTLPDASVQCVATSPPYYGLRNYNVDGQIGLEETPAEYVSKLTEVFREVHRVLKDDGTLWLNLGDSYGTGTKAVRQPSRTSKKISLEQHKAQGARHGGQAKQLLMIPARVAIALQDDGWILRSDIIWHKPSAMPESVTDRPTKSHEYLFLLAKNERYYYCADAIREPHLTESNVRNRAKESDWTDKALFSPLGEGEREWNHPNGRNRRTVWTVNTQPYPGAHFAVMPPKLVEPCILAGSRPGDIVLDPFSGSGTVAQVAVQTGRQYLGIELNPEYIKLAQKRLASVQVNLWDAMTPTVDTIAAMLPSQAQDDQSEEKGA